MPTNNTSQSILNIKYIINLNIYKHCLKCCLAFAGECACENDHGLPDCSVQLSQPPRLYDLKGQKVCDVLKFPCNVISVVGSTFVDSQNLSCNLQRVQVNALCCLAFPLFKLIKLYRLLTSLHPCIINNLMQLLFPADQRKWRVHQTGTSGACGRRIFFF